MRAEGAEQSRERGVYDRKGRGHLLGLASHEVDHGERVSVLGQTLRHHRLCVCVCVSVSTSNSEYIPWSILMAESLESFSLFLPMPVLHSEHWNQILEGWECDHRQCPILQIGMERGSRMEVSRPLLLEQSIDGVFRSCQADPDIVGVSGGHGLHQWAGHVVGGVR